MTLDEAKSYLNFCIDLGHYNATDFENWPGEKLVWFIESEIGVNEKFDKNIK